jgi:hypothetical protein
MGYVMGGGTIPVSVKLYTITNKETIWLTKSSFVFVEELLVADFGVAA